MTLLNPLRFDTFPEGLQVKNIIELHTAMPDDLQIDSAVLNDVVSWSRDGFERHDQPSLTLQIAPMGASSWLQPLPSIFNSPSFEFKQILLTWEANLLKRYLM